MSVAARYDSLVTASGGAKKGLSFFRDGGNAEAIKAACAHECMFAFVGIGELSLANCAGALTDTFGWTAGVNRLTNKSLPECSVRLKFDLPGHIEGVVWGRTNLDVYELI